MKRHSTDLVSLVFGLIFVAASAWWLAGQYVHIDVPHLGWITAAVLIGLGLLGLFGSLRSERAEPASVDSGPAPGSGPAPASMTRPTSAPLVFQPVDEPSFRTDVRFRETAHEESHDEPDDKPREGSDEGPDEGPRDAPGTDIR